MTTPCRCGHTGDGPHRCHAGRPDPATGEDGSRWCTADAVPVRFDTRARAYVTCLAGVQMKLGAEVTPAGTAYYCAAHFEECTGHTLTTPEPTP
jgi:hypothetical protein